MKTVLIASGGTGGHIFPGILLANKLKDNYMILFVGNRSGMEYKIVNRNKFKFLHIPSAGFVGKSLYDKCRAIIMNLISFIACSRYIIKYKPVFVIGTGSFTEISLVLSAFLFRIPSFITEQDSYPGTATRLLSRVATNVFLSFEESRKYIRNRNNISIVGTLTENKVDKINEHLIRKKMNIEKNKRVLFIIGGSRGAAVINNTVIEMMKSGIDKRIYVIFQTGEINYESVMKKLKNASFNGIIKPFIYNMSEIYSISDLIVSRAGACTLAEISDNNKPSILIPFPYATHNHQMKNAINYQNNGASIVIDEKNLSGIILKNIIENTIFNNKKLSVMGENAGVLHNNNAVNDMIKIIYRRLSYV
jgi:UDP-N-acetylglucosamine--N-acetylmuramyl-(pentapeptide) pyrophosphoryl-undecaprenol N-acetylglucosamine transferase